MKEIKINRLWHGSVSIRDYVAKGALSRREDRLISVKGFTDRMIIPWKDLSKGKTNREVFKSKHNNQTYSLVDYPWKPNTGQKGLFEDKIK